MPKVTVFTPVYNCEDYISETIQSILNQTYEDFEYLLIDDCSTDRSVDIIESFSDPRIRLIKNEINQGISYNRNLAIDESNGDYLAMIDGDDIALSQRLEKQIEFLEKHPEYGIIGTEIIHIDAQGKEMNQSITFPIPDEQIPSRMLFNNYIYTSSATIRKSVFEEGIRFKKSFIVAEDYEVWIQLIRKSKIGHIREPLTKYRIHDQSISIQKKQLMLDTEIKIINIQLNELKCPLNSEELKIFSAISKENHLLYINKYKEVNSLIAKLIQANNRSKIFNSSDFKKHLYQYWHIYFLNIRKFNPITLINSIVNGMFLLLPIKKRLLFLIKCMILYKV